MNEPDLNTIGLINESSTFLIYNLYRSLIHVGVLSGDVVKSQCREWIQQCSSMGMSSACWSAHQGLIDFLTMNEPSAKVLLGPGRRDDNDPEKV